MRLPRQKTRIDHKPMATRSSPVHPVIAGLKARVEALQTELAKVEAAAAGHRADFERERQRAEELVSELLGAIEDGMTAREKTGTARRRTSNRAVAPLVAAACRLNRAPRAHPLLIPGAQGTKLGQGLVYQRMIESPRWATDQRGIWHACSGSAGFHDCGRRAQPRRVRFDR